MVAKNLPKELHKTSVANQLRNGARSGIDGCNVSRGAVIAAQSAAEHFIADLGAQCLKILQLQKKKTVTRDLLLSLLRDHCHNKFILGEAQKGVASGRVKADREPIAVSSVLRVFSKSIPLGEKAYRVADDAKYVLAKACRAYIVQLGKLSSGYTDAGRRSTVKATDVTSALSCMA